MREWKVPTSATSELYFDQENAGSTANFQAPQPPPPAAPQRVEVAQPVPTKARMADERPDGSVKDTSTDALKPGNDLNFRNVDDEALKNKKDAAAKEADAAKPPDAAAPPAEATPPAPKLYAGKFKSPEELETGYSEAEKAMHKAMQEASDLRKKFEAAETAKAATPAAPPVKTPEQVKQETEDNSKLLNDFVSNPREFINKSVAEHEQQMQVALKAAQTAEQWRRENPDLVEHEIRVAFEASVLQQQDPELAKDPNALIAKATANFRQMVGKIRTEGAKEALTTETRSIPLLSNTAQPTASGEPEKAPLTWDDAFDSHLKMLKAEEQRSHRGLRR